MQNTKFTSIDQYIDAFTGIQKDRLIEMRHIIQSAIPKTVETISYGMPAYKLKRVVVYFAAAKKHIGFYPTNSGISNFERELKSYQTSKGAVQFPLDAPLPADIITLIAQFRYVEEGGTL